MEFSEKQIIEIFICGQPVSLQASPQRREKVKNIEKEINTLSREWRKNYPQKSDMEILAMITYQYASYYQDLKERYAEAELIAKSCNEALEKISF